ncbi:MAG TPA: serine/threonine-protein kinase, partial [Thermoanaerobaculia bacterium]|nr:serine/threonine-protein kinase [Thermoanaerobaculia bacterium]
RGEIERLLAVDERLGSFLEQPAVQDLGAEKVENETLGPYRLLRRLGGGGMGTVYLARRDDEHYDRLVAIKILRSGLEETEIYHRFLAERQTLARLEHPNIARLYDGGSTADGRPYLVMELVEGLPVDAYCDRHRLTIDRRLELFQRICGAVQYAHQNLLVHRDIKPLNILVTEDGEPKLLDFGIAKQLGGGEESGAQTRTGLRVMTPSYASPEQVRGEAITTASDVYSLGVLLYELLVGRSPYRLTTGLPHEIEAAICEQEPERPSQALVRSTNAGEMAAPPEAVAAARDSRVPALSRRLAGDLDNIVLKALRKEVPRRYASAAALAQDVAAHLQNLPVAARPDTLAYRTRMFVRRHRAAVLAAAAVLALVAGFLVSLVFQGRQLARERDKANYTLSFLVDTFQQADPFHTRGEHLTAREILDRGAGRVSRELAGQPDVQAALMDAIGRVNLGLGRVDRAAPLLEGALAVRRKALGRGTLEIAQSLDHVAAVRFQRSDFKGSEELLRQSLALKRRLPGENVIEVARTLNLLGETVARRGDPKAAEVLHRQALDVARGAEGREGLTVSASLIALARRLDEQGNYPVAEKLLREGLAMETHLLGEENAEVISHREAFAELLVNQGKFSAAESAVRRNIEVERKIVGEGHPDLAGLYNDLAVALTGQRRHSEAEALYQRSLAVLRASYGPMDFRVAEALGNLGGAFEGEKKYEDAVTAHQQALEIRLRLYGPGGPEVGHSLLHLAKARRELGQPELAVPLAQQALTVLEGVFGPVHPYTAYAHLALGLALRDQGKANGAEPHLRQGLTSLVKALPPGHPQITLNQLELANCLADLGHLDEADSLLRQALPRLQTLYGPGEPAVKRAEGLVASIAHRRGSAVGASYRRESQ